MLGTNGFYPFLCSFFISKYLLITLTGSFSFFYIYIYFPINVCLTMYSINFCLPAACQTCLICEFAFLHFILIKKQIAYFCIQLALHQANLSSNINRSFYKSQTLEFKRYSYFSNVFMYYLYSYNWFWLNVLFVQY